MTGSEHWMMPLKNSCGNYEKQMKTRLRERLANRVGATLAASCLGDRYALMSACLALVFAFLLPIPLAHAAANGRIYGRLLDGTKKNVPVVGQSVMLQMAQGNNARDVTSIKTDAHGSFAFNGLNTGKTINYAVYTRYQGAQYYTDLINLSTK